MYFYISEYSISVVVEGKREEGPKSQAGQRHSRAKKPPVTTFGVAVCEHHHPSPVFTIR